jgi:hypothetical protein
VQEQRDKNVYINDSLSEDDFVAMRQVRDAGLAVPARLMPSIQVNIRAGRFPPAGANGVRYMMVPLKTKNPVSAQAVEPRR